MICGALLSLVPLLGQVAGDLREVEWHSAEEDGPRADEAPWYLDLEQAHRKPWRKHRRGRCREPRDLPEQFLSWFRESQADAGMMAYMGDVAGHSPVPHSPVPHSPVPHSAAKANKSSRRSRRDLRLPEAAICGRSAAGSEESLMERSLCPWEWKVNRDAEREPRLISEAVCQCRAARGVPGAICLPILREFPVLRRVVCRGRRARYVRSFETVAVGCHSVRQRTAHAQSPLQHLRSLTHA